MMDTAACNRSSWCWRDALANEEVQRDAVSGELKRERRLGLGKRKTG